VTTQRTQLPPRRSLENIAIAHRPSARRDSRQSSHHHQPGSRHPERVLTERDPDLLERWLEKAAVAASVGEVIDEPS
jgi:hypothetical protein